MCLTLARALVGWAGLLTGCVHTRNMDYTLKPSFFFFRYSMDMKKSYVEQIGNFIIKNNLKICTQLNNNHEYSVKSMRVFILGFICFLMDQIIIIVRV
jgi:hypothetical protein